MQRTQKRAVNRRARQNKTPETVGRIPPFSASVQTSKTFRYIAFGGPFSGTISDTDFYTMLVQAASATAAHSLFQSVKLNRVSIWGAPPGTTGGATVSCEFLGSNSGGPSGPSRIFSDTVLGTSGTAKLVVKPPKTSYAGMWLGTSGEGVISLVVPEGSVVDLDVTFVLSNGVATLASTTIAAGTAGAIYSLALDFTGSAVLAPVSYATVSS